MGHHHEQKVPKSILWGALGMMLLALGVSAYARRDAEATTELAPATVVATAELRFEDRPDGSIGVLEGHTGREVSVVPPGSNGFIRGVLRGMFRTRKLESKDRNAPFRLTRYSDGRIGLEDLASDRRVDLSSFGPDNHAAFAKLLHAAARGPRSAQR